MNLAGHALFAVIMTAAIPSATVGQEGGEAPAPAAAPAGDEASAVEVSAEAGACDGRPFSMQLTVQNVKDARGTITVDVHDDDPEKFLKSGGKLARLRVPAVAGETQFCIAVPHAGIYALAVYHDRNANLKLDKTWIGLPSEPFGLSNNPPMRLAVPKLKDSAFAVDGPYTPVAIHLSK